MACLGFNLEWFDIASEILHSMQLKFFLNDGTIEIVENGKAFLKRIYYPDVKFEDLYIGGSLNIYDRLMIIKGYCNTATQEHMESRECHVLVVVSDSSVLGQVMLTGKSCGFRLGHGKTTSSSNLVNGMQISAGDIVLEMVGLNGEEAFRRLSQSLSRMSGVQIARCTAEQITTALRECSKLSVDSNCTLCLIKPHAVRQDLGNILQAIVDRRFRIRGLFAVHMTLSMANEFYDAYKTVFLNFSQVVDQACSGVSVALIIEGPVQDFREFCGPVHPEVAKALRPQSLRARFGKTQIQNCVHCTDLPDDGEMECKYFFESLASLY